MRKTKKVSCKVTNGKTMARVVCADADRFRQTVTASFVLLAVLVFMLIAAVVSSGQAAAQANVRPPENAVRNAVPSTGEKKPASVPSKVKTQDGTFWRGVKDGVRGNVSIPDKKAGVLVQTQGEEWRQTRAVQLPRIGSYALMFMLVGLGAFYMLRGRIRVARGFSGETIERFTNIERTAHWLMAVSFIILGLTGLNLTFGKAVVMPILGKDLFANLAMLGKWLHNYVAFAFMISLVAAFLFWLRHNIPDKTDVKWLAQGGGMFSKDAHPAARKFNAGQKILFWLIMLLGLSISFSGIALLFPFQFSMFAKTFALINVFGFGLPTELSALEEMQYAATWHAVIGLFMVLVIIAHIYIGTLGMEGAFDAMGTGQVDVNWAREHHSLWAEEVLGPDPSGHGSGGSGSPANDAGHADSTPPQPAE